MCIGPAPTSEWSASLFFVSQSISCCMYYTGGAMHQHVCYYAKPTRAHICHNNIHKRLLGSFPIIPFTAIKSQRTTLLAHQSPTPHTSNREMERLREISKIDCCVPHLQFPLYIKPPFFFCFFFLPMWLAFIDCKQSFRLNRYL